MSTRSPKIRSSANLTRSSSRRGFTLIEILIVIVMISLVSLVAIPRFATGNGRRNMESARMRLASALATARQAAIQKGQTVRFMVKYNRVTVVESGVNLMSPVPLDTLYKVNVPNVTDSLVIDYNARGFASVGTTKTIRLSRSGVADDSLTVLSTGMVQR